MSSSPPHGGSSSPLDAGVIARGAQLLHAQCWLWGQDLRSPLGDLLAACGLETSTFVGATSHRRYYRERLGLGRFVVAWGGGYLFGAGTGALFFPRLQFAPCWLDGVRSIEAVPDLNQVGSAPTLLRAESRALLVPALDWLVGYERAVLRDAGPQWRATCAARWTEIEEGARDVAASVGVRYEPLPPLPNDGLASSWEELRCGIARGHV